MGALARELDVTPPAIYSYFSGIDAIRTALASRRLGETEFFGDNSPGDFTAYLTHVLVDCRESFGEQNLNPELFGMELGGGRLRGKPNLEILKRMERFLESASESGVDSETSMRIFWVMSDLMAHSKLMTMTPDWVSQFHRELAEDLSQDEAKKFVHLHRYLSEGKNRSLTADDFFLELARMLGTALMSGTRSPDDPAPS